MTTVTSCMNPVTTMQPKSETSPPALTSASYRTYGLCLAASLLSGLLLWMCYHPLSLGMYLGWIALVPFLVLVRVQMRPVLVYLFAWVCGITFFAPALQWMRVADYRMNATWGLLALYCAFYFPVALFLLRRLERWRLPIIITVPLVWAALEYVRSFLMTGFAWYLLAHTQHEVLSMIQVTDLGGVYLVSFIVAAVNAFLFDCVYQIPEIRQWFQQTEMKPYHHYASLDFLNRSFFADWLLRRNLILEGTGLAVLLCGTYFYGVYRLNQGGFTEGPIVSLLQSNLDQRIRDQTGGKTNNEETTELAVTQHYAALCARAVKDHFPAPNLIIWPETSYPRPWVEISTKLPPTQIPTRWREAEIDIRKNLEMLNYFGTRQERIPHLLGMNAHFLDEQARHRHYNSALLLNKDGNVEARFDKIHRVPFGEYVPLKDWIPFMNVLAPYDFDYSVQKGENLTRFKIKNHKGIDFDFGVLICYEDSDPFLARGYMEQSEEGPPVDFLVNISNDGWFDGSYEHEEHLVVSRFRAIECRRAMVRAVNMGVSALVDGNGRVLKPTPHPVGTPPIWVVRESNGHFVDLPIAEWHTFKKVSGILTATVPIDHRFSFYIVAGDWLPISCWLFLATGAVWSCVWCKRQAKTASS